MPPRATDPSGPIRRPRTRHQVASAARLAAGGDSADLAALGATALCANPDRLPRTEEDWRAQRRHSARFAAFTVYVADDPELGAPTAAIGVSRRWPWLGYRLEYLALGTSARRLDALTDLLDGSIGPFAPCVAELRMAPGSRLDPGEVALVRAVLRAAAFRPTPGGAGAGEDGAAEAAPGTDGCVVRLTRRGALVPWALSAAYDYLRWD